MFDSFFSRKLLLTGDIETNPGPNRNLSNIPSHNFAKVQLLKTYFSTAQI